MTEDATDRSAAAIERRRRLQGGMLRLEIEDLLEIVPHRPPLLLLDRVISLVPGEHAVAQKNVCGDEAGLDHHKHGFVFPSTFAAEALTQLAQLVVSGVAVPEDRTPAARVDAETWPVLVAIDALQVHQELLAPGPVHLSVSRVDAPESTGSPDSAGPQGGTGVLVHCAGQVTAETGLLLEARLTLRRP